MSDSSGASGTSGATATTPDPTEPAKSGSRKSGGASANDATGADSGQDSSGGSGSGSSGESGSGKGGDSEGKAKTVPPKLVTVQQKELYKQAKTVCGWLTLDGLAKEYIVKATPSAVAHAYSKGYSANVRSAVYAGCKAGVTKG